VGVPGRVVVVKNHHVGAAQRLAVFGAPFRFLADFGCAIEVAGCRESETPKRIAILLTFDDQNGAAGFDRGLDLRQSIERPLGFLGETPNPCPAFESAT
jgi:hypothetical protein